MLVAAGAFLLTATATAVGSYYLAEEAEEEESADRQKTKRVRSKLRRAKKDAKKLSLEQGEKHCAYVKLSIWKEKSELRTSEITGYLKDLNKRDNVVFIGFNQPLPDGSSVAQELPISLSAIKDVEVVATVVVTEEG